MSPEPHPQSVTLPKARRTYRLQALGCDSALELQPRTLRSPGPPRPGLPRPLLGLECRHWDCRVLKPPGSGPRRTLGNTSGHPHQGLREGRGKWWEGEKNRVKGDLRVVRQDRPRKVHWGGPPACSSSPWHLLHAPSSVVMVTAEGTDPILGPPLPPPWA